MRLDLYRALKPLVDFIVASVGLVIFSPILCVTAVLVLVCDGHPVFFRQERSGINGTPFNLVKFRTMTEQDSSYPQEITRLGYLLRRTSVDELPSLWNVIRGDMSLVGPRPLLVEYLPNYSPHHQKRHSVLPGITGLAQVSGRNLLSWNDKLDLDAKYVEKRGFLLDLAITLKTVLVVLSGRGVYNSTHSLPHRLTQDYDRR